MYLVCSSVLLASVTENYLTKQSFTKDASGIDLEVLVEDEK